MSNMYEGIGPDDVPTAPYPVQAASARPAAGGPGSSAPRGGAPRGSAPRGGAPRGGPGSGGGWSRGRRAAALIAVCAVVGGGAFAVTEAVTGAPATAQTAGTQAGTIQAGTSASVTGQAAALRDALNSSGIRRLARLRRLGGMYGQYTFQTASGPRTLAFERGTIVSVSGGDVLVRAADGVTWTWALTGTSVIRENGTKEPRDVLGQGQTVFAGGPVVSGTKDARLIVIRKAATSAQTQGNA
jgi:hypothetical protein